MEEQRKCSECGTLLPVEIENGACPKCFLALALKAGAGRHLQIRCPHCRNLVGVVDEAELGDVTCPSCDSRFSLVDDSTVSIQQGKRNRIQHFELLECVGTGGFGSVWKALDTELDRIVAIKVPRRDQLSGMESEQFLREARASAQLRHPNIVSVHEVGRADGLLYIVSDYVDGVTLADQLSAQPPTVDESTRLCAAIAEALQHAHEHGVIHRDLKPSNILLERTSQAAVTVRDYDSSDQPSVVSYESHPAHRTPHITDFGLARRESGEITMTVEGRILGTPAYMSPEQARGEGHRADARSDIYSLGAILFELLTGEKPFRGTSRMLLDQVLHDDAPSPRKFNAVVPRDLETICLKCLEKDPTRRYHSAQALADELHRYRRGEPIHARPITRLQRGWRWCRRKPLVAGLAAGLVLAITVGFAGVTWKWSDAATAQSLAEFREKENRQRLVHYYVAEGNRRLDDGDWQAAGVWFAEALQQDEQESARVDIHRARLASLAANTPRLAHMLFHPEEVRDCQYSPDGSRILTIGDRYARLWDASTGKPLTELLKHEEYIWSAKFTPDGRRFVTLSMHFNATSDEQPHLRQVRVYDVQTGKLAYPPLNLPGVAPRVWFTPDGERFILMVKDTVQIRDMESGDLVHEPLQHPYRVYHLAISSGGDRLLTGCGYHDKPEVRVWDVASGRSLGQVISRHYHFHSDAAFSADGRMFVTWSDDRPTPGPFVPVEVCIWNSDSAEQVGEPIEFRRRSHSGTNDVLRFAGFTAGTPSRVMTVQHDDTVGMWDVSGKAMQMLPEPSSHHGYSSFFGEYAAGRQIVTMGDDIQILNYQTGKLVSQFEADSSYRYRDAEFSPDGRRVLLTGTHWGKRTSTARLIDVVARQSWLFHGPAHHHRWARFSPSGAELVTITEQGIARVWTLVQMAPKATPFDEMSSGDVYCQTLSRDGRLLAVGSGPHDMGVDRGGENDWGQVDIFDLQGQRRECPPAKLDARIKFAIFSPDRRFVATIDRYDRVALIDAKSGQILGQPIPEKDMGAQQITFSENSQQLILLCRPREEWGYGINRERVAEQPELRRWDTRAGQLSDEPRKLPALPLHQLSPTGDKYFGVSQQGLAFLASTDDDSRQVEFGQLGKLRSVAFSEGGQRLVTINDDNMARVYRTDVGEPIAPLIRNVTAASFSQSGRMLLTYNTDEQAQVWDAATSQPISPRLKTQHLIHGPTSGARAVFGPNEASVVSVANGHLRAWPLKSHDYSSEQWRRLMQLAAGNHVDTVAGYAPLDFAEQQQVWGEFISDFATNPNNQATEAWHRRQAWEAEKWAPNRN